MADGQHGLFTGVGEYYKIDSASEDTSNDFNKAVDGLAESRSAVKAASENTPENHKALCAEFAKRAINEISPAVKRAYGEDALEQKENYETIRCLQNPDAFLNPPK